ncbi:MAG TPA: VOC family protein [Woeseiaceae bacterium]|nr:VOC family protein [Woeseiaceae bacterium]
MHRSRFAGFIIDCRTDDLEAASAFWSAALGSPERPNKEPRYVSLDTAAGEPHIEVQQVDHPSRVHIDLESDDIPAEVARLEALGARKVADVRDWCVMEAPTGQRFCIVPVVRAGFAEKANVWP